MLSDICVQSLDNDRKELINQLKHVLAVEIPSLPPKEYRPVNWDEIREMHAGKIEIGSHTMNHPILSKISKEHLSNEISESKRYIEDKLDHPVHTFCYPNGMPEDINENVIEDVGDNG